VDLGIAGRSAFIAGGSKGIGRSAAGLLAAEGCRVAVVAREQKSIDRAVEEISDLGGMAIGITADLATRDGVHVAVAAATEAFGPPEIVVGLVNDQTVARALDAVDEDFERVFGALTMSQVYLARATVPAMQANEWGRYIHVGSLVSKEPQFLHPHVYHNTVRPSTVAYLRTLAQEVAPDQVTVNVVAPAWTITPQLEDSFARMGLTPEQGREWLGGKMFDEVWLGPANIPMKRGAEPDEVGGVVAFLASQYAGYLTGELIAITGAKHFFAF
jgi:NAD(P)-dependent dehydrogenase (short-subunit alcohol dehydrogenase family)